MPKRKHHHNKRVFGVVCISLLLIALFVVFVVPFVFGQPKPSFIVKANTGMYQAINGTDGVSSFSTNASYVSNLAVSNGGLIKFDGNFILTAPILLSSNTIVDLTDAKITLGAGANNFVFSNPMLESGIANVTILNGEINGAKNLQSSNYVALIQFYKATNCLVKGTYIHDAYCWSICFQSGSYNTLEYVISKDSGYDGIMFANGESHGLIDSCKVYNAGSGGVMGDGFSIYRGAADCIVKNSYATGCLGVGFAMATNYQLPVYRNIFDNCTSNRNGAGFMVGPAESIDVVYGATIKNCQASFNKAWGIVVINTQNFVLDNCLISDNSFGTSAYPGLEIQDSNGVSIKHSIFIDDQLNPTQTYGIKIAGATNNITLIGNTFADNRLAPVYIADSVGLQRVISGNIGYP